MLPGTTNQRLGVETMKKMILATALTLVTTTAMSAELTVTPAISYVSANLHGGELDIDSGYGIQASIKNNTLLGTVSISRNKISGLTVSDDYTSHFGHMNVVSASVAYRFIDYQQGNLTVESGIGPTALFVTEEIDDTSNSGFYLGVAGSASISYSLADTINVIATYTYNSCHITQQYVGVGLTVRF